jgi:selenocysteine lyase/cysteine desulfurase
VPIDMHPPGAPGRHKDAVFLSVHKYLGGPQAPGLLVANRALFRNRAPADPGGGTVLYTTPWDHRYLDDLTAREEAGTPNIVGVIRAGLAFQLKGLLGTERILRVEEDFVRRALRHWGRFDTIHILGNPEAPRLGIISVVLDGGRLHHNLAARLLSDLWGIQARAGCMCAGPYGHELLGIGPQKSFEIRCALDRGELAAKPGYTRFCFSPATTEEEFRVLLDAVVELAHDWRQWADDYELEPGTDTWHHRAADEHPLAPPLTLQGPEDPAVGEEGRSKGVRCLGSGVRVHKSQTATVLL